MAIIGWFCGAQRMEKHWKRLFWIFVVITGIIAGAGLLTMDFADKMIFHPTKLTEKEAVLPDDLPMTSLKIDEGPVLLDGRYLEVPDAKYVVMICHNGVGNLYDRADFYRFWKDLGLSVMAFDYRGFGLSLGDNLTEESIKEDANGVYGRLLHLKWSTRQIILYGQGIGAYATAEIAERSSCAAWIAENPIPSLDSIMPDYFRRLLLKGRFNLRALLPKMDIPALFLISSQHPVIPLALAQSLPPLTRHGNQCVIDGGDHRLLAQTHPEEVRTCLRSFLRKLNPETR
jgi:pimeloyl-ACP methyl ester carboxylesterase